MMKSVQVDRGECGMKIEKVKRNQGFQRSVVEGGWWEERKRNDKGRVGGIVLGVMRLPIVMCGRQGWNLADQTDDGNCLLLVFQVTIYWSVANRQESE